MYTLAELKEKFDNEQVLIVLLSRLYFGKSVVEEITNFVSNYPIDANNFYWIARVHNIRPFLFHVISSNNIKIESKLYEQLKKFHLQNQLRSMEQLVITYQVIKELEDKNISVIPFKGVVFAHSYYGNIGLRESSDIDLFISAKDIKHVEDHFLEKGFEPKVAVPSKYLNYFRKYFKEIVYTAPAKTNQGYSVEIHWKLLNYYFGSYPAFDFFETGKTNTKIGEMYMPSLDVTKDLLAVASNHFVKDLGVKFKYLVDIACLIHSKQDKLNVALISETIEQHQCRKRIETGLDQVNKLLGVKISHYHFKNNFTIDKNSFTLTTPLYLNNFMPSDIRFLKLSSSLQDNFIEKIKFFGRCFYYLLLPTDNDLNSTKLKLPVFTLSLFRPFRLLTKAIAKIISSGNAK